MLTEWKLYRISYIFKYHNKYDMNINMPDTKERYKTVTE